MRVRSQSNWASHMRFHDDFLPKLGLHAPHWAINRLLMVTFGFLNISFDDCLRCSRPPAPQGNVSHRYHQDRLRSHRPTHSSPSALVCYVGNRPRHDGERAEYIALMSTTDRPVGLVVENAQRWMTPCCRCLGPQLALSHRASCCCDCVRF
jgi:hypothetical protein